MDRILSFEGLRKFAVKAVFVLAMGLGCCLAAAPGVRAQAAGGGGGDNSGQTKPVSAQESGQKQSSQESPQKSDKKSSPASSQAAANPFPTDLSTVPVIPTGNSPGMPEGSAEGSGNGGFTLPDRDPDPVPSPDDAGASTGSGQKKGFSSSLSGLGPLLPGAEGDLPGSGNEKNVKDGGIAPLPQPSAEKDVSVGNFYLDTHDWKGAYSRFQSALVLDPENPDVYWGLAECERHLGQYAAARANYLKVLEYDPGSKHAKQAAKALRDPEIAKAKAGSGG
jgi:tetratricopeptide (TPR) repeat protein